MLPRPNMINQNADEAITNITTAERQKSRLGISGRFASFARRRESSRGSRQECKEDDDATNDTARTQVEHKFKTDIFRNVKKYLQVKNLCRTKQKDKEAAPSSTFYTTCEIVSAVDPVMRLPDISKEQEHSSSQQDVLSNRQSCETDMSHMVPVGEEDKAICDITSEISDAIEQPSCSNVTAEVPSEEESSAEEPSAVADVPCDTVETLSDENKVKASLAEELLNLCKYGWYWGPMSADQADTKLISEPDGAFLVRDSSDDRYVLTLSFKSSGKILHTRMEHSGGLFSLCNQCESDGFTSVAALINDSMNFSQSAVFCYSRPRYPGYPSFPVRLTKPVSRFTKVKSLQYLCRFVIRQNTSLDNINKLLLPETVKSYLLEPHYWT